MRASTIRLFVEQPLEQGLDVVCSRAQANYLLNVMRLGDGAQILVFDGTTGEWRASVSRQKRSDCTLHVLDRVRPQEDGPDVHYLFAPVKRARLDFMVQKATELGVAALCPVLTSRTDVSRVKFERMRANVIEAAEQCGVLRIHKCSSRSHLTSCLRGGTRHAISSIATRRLRFLRRWMLLVYSSPGRWPYSSDPKGGSMLASGRVFRSWDTSPKFRSDRGS